MTDWNDIRLFSAVVATGSFSAAARAAGTTQATVSRRMKALEDQLGDNLFVRGLEGVTLTPFAEGLAAPAQDMSAAAEAWGRALAQHSAIRRRIVVACGELIGGFLSRHMGVLHHGLDGVDIEIKASTAFVDIAKGDADLALRNKRPAKGALKARKLRSSKYGAFSVFGAKEFFADAAFETVEDLKSFAWISSSQGDGKLASARWIHNHIGEDSIRFRMNSTPMILAATRQNEALALLPRFIGHDEDHLVEVFGPVDGIAFDMWFVRRDEGRPDPAMERLISNLEELFV
ncbi:MAG: LysR family transcriptional regulator [Pseudomonadota bacterium]